MENKNKQSMEQQILEAVSANESSDLESSSSFKNLFETDFSDLENIIDDQIARSEVQQTKLVNQRAQQVEPEVKQEAKPEVQQQAEPVQVQPEVLQESLSIDSIKRILHIYSQFIKLTEKDKTVIKGFFNSETNEELIYNIINVDSNNKNSIDSIKHTVDLVNSTGANRVFELFSYTEDQIDNITQIVSMFKEVEPKSDKIAKLKELESKISQITQEEIKSLAPIANFVGEIEKD